MQSGFRLADPAEYRRGVILGLTLAEVLTLLVFLLLLSTSALMARRARELATLKASFAKYDSLLAPVADRAARRGVSLSDADQLVSLIIRGGDADRLRAELDSQASALAAARAESARAAQEARRLAEQVASLPEGTRTLAAKAADDDEMQALLVRASPQGSTAAERLRRILDRTSKVGASNLNLTGQNAQMRGELARLKGNGGSGLPYCWTTVEGRPVYMLKVELQDDGIVVHDIQPRARPDDPAWPLLAPVPRDAKVSMASFLSAVAPLQAAGVTGRCRYAVLAFDGTGVTNKPGYKSLMGHLWTAFMVHEVGR